MSADEGEGGAAEAEAGRGERGSRGGEGTAGGKGVVDEQEMSDAISLQFACSLRVDAEGAADVLCLGRAA